MPASNTIKILMLVLFLAAGLVVIRVGILINKTFHPAAARIYPSFSAIDYGESDDFDHDGLDNGEEAVWHTDPYNPDSDQDSYLDGEEVFSDHDPSLAEDDSLSKTRAFLAMNSTERLAQAITGGLLSGDLAQSNPQTFAQNIDTVAGSTVYSILSALENVEIDEALIAPVESTLESQTHYLETVFSIISKDISAIAFNQPKELVLLFSPDQLSNDSEIYDAQQKERIKSAFLRHSIKFQEAFDHLQTTAVPRNWSVIHQEILTLLKKLELYYRSIALSTEDPFKQMVVLGNLQSVYLEAQPILIAINGKIKKEGLPVPDNDFFDIALLLNK